MDNDKASTDAVDDENHDDYRGDIKVNYKG